MHQFSGSLQAIELSATLWLIPLLPLLAAAFSALKRASPDEDRPEALSIRWHLGAALAALALLLYQVAELASLPAHQRFLLDTLGSALRIGSLEVGLSVSLDPLSALVGVLVLVCGVVAMLHLALPEASKPEPAEARRFEALSLGLGSMLLLVLASNLAILLVGWAGASLAAFVLAPPGRGGIRFALARFADVALLAGAALLFWTQGGAWSRSGVYMPDFEPRIAAVESKLVPGADQNTPRPTDQQASASASMNGRLSLASLPGATVSIGGAKLCETSANGERGGLGVPSGPCREDAHAPFEELPIPTAIHDFRIDPGPGANPLLVEKVRVSGGERIRLALVGSTLDFREMRDQLHLRDKSGAYVLRTAFYAKRIWRLPALTLALILMALAGLTKSADWVAGDGPSSRSASLLLGGGGLVAGTYLIARLAFYLPLAPTAAGLVALAGAIMALAAGASLLASRDPGRIARGFAVGQVGLCLVGIGSGALAAGALQLLVAVPAAVVLLLAAGDLERALGRDLDLAALGGLGTVLPGTARAWFVAALAATAAPYPLLGAFWSRESILWDAFTSDNTGFVPGALLFALGVLASTALCFAVWRAYFLLFAGKATRKEKPQVKDPPAGIHNRLLAGLAWFSLLVGLLEASDAVLASGSPIFPALLDKWMAPLTGTAGLSFEPLGTGMRLGLLLVGFGVPLFAWSAARRRYGPGRLPDWREQEQRLWLFKWLEREVPVSRWMEPLGRGVIAAGEALVRLDGALAFGAQDEGATEGAGESGGGGDDTPRGDENDDRSESDEGESEGDEEGDESDAGDEEDDAGDEEDDDEKDDAGDGEDDDDESESDGNDQEEEK